MATIVKRKNFYQVRIRLKGYPQETASFDRKTDAVKWASQRETELRQGKHLKEAQSKRHTFGEMIDRYIQTEAHKKPKSYQKKKAQLNRWKSELGHLRLFDVTPNKISAVKEKMLNEKLKNGKKKSPATVVRYMAALSPVYKKAVNEWEWLDKSPMSKVERPTEPRGRIRFLNDEERKRLLEAAQAHRNKHLYTIIVLAISTGMRQGEIMGLTWKDVNLSDGFAILDETKNDEVRRVPLTGQALSLLKEMNKVRRIDTNFIFCDLTTTKPVFNARAWQEVVKAAEIEDFRFHDLRHTAASYLAMNGASLAEIAEILGHKTLAMVKRYAHLSHSHTASVVAAMNEKIFN
jgi:integrase